MQLASKSEIIMSNCLPTFSKGLKGSSIEFDANSDARFWNEKARRFLPCEIQVMVECAQEIGIQKATLLYESCIDTGSLQEAKNRIPFVDQLKLQRKLTSECSDYYWPIEVGKRLHLTSYGIVGYAMLSSADLITALNTAISYKTLLNLKHELRLEIVDEEARLTFMRGFRLEQNDDDVCSAMEIVKMVSLLRDLMGPDFCPRRVSLRGCRPHQFAGKAEEFLKCPIQFESECDQINFPREYLTRPLPQSNLYTYRNCLQVCEKFIAVALSADETTKLVLCELEAAMPHIPSMEQVAKKLCLSTRSLRRRLVSEGTSYNEILDKVRQKMSKRLLANTSMTIESIAEELGYGDAANFRHAFKRWTGESPRQHRLANKIQPTWRAGKSWRQDVTYDSNSEMHGFA